MKYSKWYSKRVERNIMRYVIYIKNFIYGLSILKIKNTDGEKQNYYNIIEIHQNVELDLETYQECGEKLQKDLWKEYSKEAKKVFQKLFD